MLLSSPALTTPSLTTSLSIGADSWLAAISTSTRRASAAAARICLPPFWMPVEPEAPPWFTVTAVSAMMTLTLLNGTSSSSATIWPMATCRPWPMSILPKKAETVPSALTAIYEESWSGISGGLVAPCANACPMSSTVSSPIGMPIDTTSAPPALSIARRENCAAFSCLVMVRPPSTHHRRRALDRAQDAHMRAAAAFEAGERVLDLGIVRLLVLVEQRRRRHDPAIDAVAALRHLLLDIGLLDRMRLLRRAEPGQRHHLAVAHRRHRRDAGAHRLSVHVHGAGAALREAAAEMRIVEPEIVAQRVEQRHVGIGVDRLNLAVHVEIDSSHGYGSPLGFAWGAAAESRGTRLRAPAVHFAAIANCSSVAKLVQPWAQGNTPGTVSRPSGPCVHFGDVRARRPTTRASPSQDVKPPSGSLFSFSLRTTMFFLSHHPERGVDGAPTGALVFPSVARARRDARACKARTFPVRPGPLSALHRGAFQLRTHAALPPVGHRDVQRLPAPGRQCLAVGIRTSRGTVRAAAAGRHSLLRLVGSFLENAPSEPGCKSCIAYSLRSQHISSYRSQYS